jgi:urease accessory protein
MMTIQTPIIHQRTTGAAYAGLALTGGAPRLTGLRQQGAAKAILPHVGAVPEVVFLNTAGGLTGGDRLSYATDIGDGLRAVATTQTAERAYLATDGVAQVAVRHVVGAGGWLDWLPQETILFQGARLTRTTRIDLGPGAGCLMLEAVVLGRAAMGEVVGCVQFTDRREVWQNGRPRLVEPLRIDDAVLGSGNAGLDGARAFASVAMVADGAEDAVGPVRNVLGDDGAASGFDGRLMVRMMAGDGWPLRQAIVRVLAVLRKAALPRVWQM